MKAHWEGQEEEEKTQCKLCKRQFNSIKALYGHMRSHPDRSWRGIQPPISFSSSSSISSSSSSSSSSLPSWSLTAKRGRKHVDSVAAVVGSSSSSAPGAERNSLFALIDGVSQPNENNNKNVRKKMKKLKEVNNGIENEIQELKQVKKLYKCNSCGKGFWSHQALGGHKSSHYRPKIQVLHPHLIHTPQERRILDFDLNELPPEEDDDGDGEAKQVYI